MAVDVDDAEGDLLPEGLPPEAFEQVEARIRHLEVDLVDRELVEVRENLVVVPVARVEDRLRAQTLRHDADRLDEERKFVEPGRERGLVDLDDLRPRRLEAAGLLVQQLRDSEASCIHRPIPYAAR